MNGVDWKPTMVEGSGLRPVTMGSATRAAAQKSKANRAARAAASGIAQSETTSAGPPAAAHKYDRAGLKGKRGWAKKGGGGHGKYTWGKPGDEFVEEPALSRQDPNYDSTEEEDQSNIVFQVLENRPDQTKRGVVDGIYGGNHLFGARGGAASPKLALKEFKEKCLELVDEFLTSEDVEELKDDLVALYSPMLHYEFVRRAIQLAMERHARERELVSSALSELYGAKILSAEQCSKGFERLFEIADDLVLDIPNAKKFISQFLARGVADEILPPSFLGDPLTERLGGEIVEHAKVLLSIKHGLVRLDHVWGTTSHASVEELKLEVKMILQEFLNSSDMDEACECLRKLHVPHFHHEIVKRAVVLSLDCREREQAMMSSLLAELSSRSIVTEKQMEIGFRRLFSALPDLELDAPGASRILDVFITQAVKDRCISVESAVAIKEHYIKAV